MIGPAVLLAIQLSMVPDSTYSSARLRGIVAELASQNRQVPAELAGFSAAAESEVSLLRIDGLLVERLMSVQQLALRVRWTRDGMYHERAIGMRSESRTLLAYDALTVPSFTVPVLFGNRMDLLLGPIEGAEAGGSVVASEALQEMHPLADGRESIYRFDGGDAEQYWRIDGREVTIGRIAVSVRRTPRLRTTVFVGDLYFDVERRQLVAIRGVIEEAGGRRSVARRMLESAVRTVGRIEIVMSEWGGKFWLPARQRIELQVASGIAGQEMLVLRISSRFSDLRVDELLASDSTSAETGPPTAFERHLSAASADSLGSFSDWQRPLGAATGSATFEPIRASNEMELSRRLESGLRFGTQRLRQTVRFNRIEGLFTGVGVAVPTRSGRGELMSTIGRAWAERTWRGSAGLSVSTRNTRLGVQVGRDLVSTNDFAYAADNAALLLAPLFSRDDQDYLDRRVASAYLERGRQGDAATFSLELARVSDRAVMNALRFGLVHGDSGFRENRPIRPGDYSRARLTLAVHPAVLAEYLAPGVGLLGSAELAWGENPYGRVEARLGFRRVFRGELAVSARIDAGLVSHSGPLPPQQLFELGGPTQLPGFPYKSAAGDAAMLGMLMLSVPVVLPAAMRDLPKRWRPRLAAQLYGGFADASREEVAAAVSLLERDEPPCGVTVDCRPGTRRRASAQIGLRLMDGALFVGVTRRISESDRWRFALTATVF